MSFSVRLAGFFPAFALRVESSLLTLLELATLAASLFPVRRIRRLRPVDAMKAV